MESKIKSHNQNLRHLIGSHETAPETLAMLMVEVVPLTPYIKEHAKASEKKQPNAVILICSKFKSLTL
ncbi:hypothetical protein [Serpentinicella alkaliphila]|uniref:Uncharacterized protein n=1 Tax=Serpentinicella alkaliphila TaxID=1734049 RepID=A0A4R2TCL5_9FIRM|nr:hypothetical protein [Serpentinicella alkaliphila]QUH25496.1 hypothetical protein HZR23_06760 [Serpentinicella alkaliphila]TCP99676.1 hypothetical protein EDD79_103511 [Serpentinicella alkaliphila]